MRMSTAHDVRHWVVGVIALLAPLWGPGPARGSDADFSVPARLRPQVEFWVGIFTVYGKRQVVIHDTERPQRIYTVLDFSDLEREGLSDGQVEQVMKADEEDEKARIRALLRRLAFVDPQHEPLSDEERRIVALFADDPSADKFMAASAEDRVRGQRGLRERFARGIQTAHAYFPLMESIFRDEGVPPEITRLPLIESCFNMHAYSKVGAAGVWQFMPGTARNFLRVDGVVDERLDPIAATRAAARFMRGNYERLGTWPLAIKAYNHGPSGIARAIRETGTTDPATIIETYRGPAYKFASRNFYPEFLAALQVEQNYQHYFGNLPLDPPLSVDSVSVPRPTAITAAARCAGTDTWDIASLNPSLLAAVHGGQRPIPSGYELRLPRGTGERFRTCVASLPPPPPVQVARRGPVSRRTLQRSATARAALHGAAQRRTVVHKVKAGQTLAQIASLYGCSIEQLRRDNRLKGNTIHAGQSLRIPVS
jgi:membrane-bound lytic murein transglycosylase D